MPSIAITYVFCTWSAVAMLDASPHSPSIVTTISEVGEGVRADDCVHYSIDNPLSIKRDLLLIVLVLIFSAHKYSVNSQFNRMVSEDR